MRLGQLARKLAVRPSEIVEFLASHGIHLDEGSNAKVDDDHVILIMNQFDQVESSFVSPVVPEAQVAESSLVDAVAPSEMEEAVKESGSPEEAPDSGTDEVKVELIKAAKVELSGLKVVGKIDLPEPRKKEQPLVNAESTDGNSSELEQKPQPEERKQRLYKKERPEPRRARNNPIAQEREREAQEAAKKRHAKAEQEKEQRTKNYYKRVKVSSPTKRVKLVEEPTTEMSDVELKQVPGTWIGRLFNWLTT